MPSWNDLLTEFQAARGAGQVDWLPRRLESALQDISTQREGRNVIFYSSAFLQKPSVDPALLSVTHEELNGFMSVMYGMDWSKGLTLMLHTPWRRYKCG